MMWMTRVRNTLATLAAAIFAAPVTLAAQGPVGQVTREVSRRYLELEIALQYDALRDVYAPTVQFFDPTGEVFAGPVSQGVVAGVETVIAMQKGWGLAESNFDIRASFAVGEYALNRGTLTVRSEGSSDWTPIPFVTIHRVQSGRLTERLDFGAYVESFGLGDGYDTSTAATHAAADRYLRAYLDGDLDTQAELAAPDIQFQDPTSKVFGAPSGELYQGSDELIRRRAQIYEYHRIRL